MKANKALQATIVSILIIFGTSCQSPQPHDGTYEVILPETNSPGKYIVLAINGDKYELLEKYLTRPETFITCGKINKQENNVLNLDNHIQLMFHDHFLWYQNTSLQQISQQKKLPEIYSKQIFKENSSGEDAFVYLYTQQEEKYADLHFMNKSYQLKQKTSNKGIEKYTGIENTCLTYNRTTPENISFDNGSKTYTFTRLSPSYCSYTSCFQGNESAPSFVDAIYYNDGEQVFVKLLIIDKKGNRSYCLPLQEASAKTAVYSDDNIEWQLGNHQNATLTVENQKFQYMEQGATRQNL